MQLFWIIHMCLFCCWWDIHVCSGIPFWAFFVFENLLRFIIEFARLAMSLNDASDLVFAQHVFVNILPRLLPSHPSFRLALSDGACFEMLTTCLTSELVTALSLIYSFVSMPSSMIVCHCCLLLSLLLHCMCLVFQTQFYEQAALVSPPSALREL